RGTGRARGPRAGALARTGRAVGPAHAPRRHPPLGRPRGGPTGAPRATPRAAPAGVRARAPGGDRPGGAPPRSPENGRRAARRRERSGRAATGFRAVETSMTMAVTALALLLGQGQPLPPGHPPVSGGVAPAAGQRQSGDSPLPPGHPPLAAPPHGPRATPRGGA